MVPIESPVPTFQESRNKRFRERAAQIFAGTPMRESGKGRERVRVRKGEWERERE